MFPDAQTMVLTFVDKIPPDVNAYLATADYFEMLLQPPPATPCVVWLMRCILLASVVMLILSSNLLYVRLKAEKSHFFAVNTLGLIKVDLMNLSSATCLLYSALTIVDRIFMEVIQAGHHDQSWQLVIAGTKFLLLLIDGWMLWWVCICHRLLNMKQADWKDSSPASTRMAPKSSWVMNTGFITVALWPIAPIFWAFFNLNDEYIKSKNLLMLATKSLMERAPSHPPGTFNKYQLLPILGLVSPAADHLRSLEYYLRFGLCTYLVAASTFCLAALPVLALELRSSLEYRAPVKLIGGRDSLFVETRRNQKKLILCQAFLAYAVALSFIPVIIWALLHPNGFFFATWWAVIELGLHGPVAIFGNICLFLLHRIDANPGGSKDLTPSFES